MTEKVIIMEQLPGLRKNQNFISLLFYGPALVFAIVFFIYPVVSSFYYSLTNWNGLAQTIHFTGLANFQELIRDDKFYGGIRNTLLYAFFVTVIQNIAAIALAIVLNTSLKTKNILRTVFFAPAILSALVVGYAWSFIYNPLFGVLNSLLTNIGLGGWVQDWLGDPRLALGSLIVVTVWQFTGYAMVIYLAGLQGIPEELYEAAAIDGTTPWKKFRHITFPLIAPAFTINVLLSVIGTMKIFDLIYVTTNGGPGYATETMTTLLYHQAFQTNRMGYGTAMAVVLFLIILVLSLFQLKTLRKREVVM
ncbi:MAG TPA: sugar ABC transporter permease [Firmicutes bacterium]|nr:sugar ABC transporter permease [Bacillota bacterium]